MKNRSLLAAALIFASGASFAATEISDVTIPDTIALQGETLNYNGAGVRSKFFIDLYVGSLFTANTTHDAKSVIDSKEATAIRLNITSNIITSEKMSKAMNEGFELAAGDNKANLNVKIKDFIQTFSAPIQKGDQFTLLSVPGEGLISYKNGEFLSITAGEDFRKTVLAIWLGEKPTDKSLKEDMLGA